MCIGAPAGKKVHATFFGGYKLHVGFDVIGVASLDCVFFLFFEIVRLGGRRVFNILKHVRRWGALISPWRRGGGRVDQCVAKGNVWKSYSADVLAPLCLEMQQHILGGRRCSGRKPCRRSGDFDPNKGRIGIHIYIYMYIYIYISIYIYI